MTGREPTCLCRGHVHNVLPGGDDCFQCHCTTPPGRGPTPDEQHARAREWWKHLPTDERVALWQASEGREATPEDVAYAAVVAVRDAYPRLPDDADSWEVAEFVVAKLRAAGHIAEVPDA